MPIRVHELAKEFKISTAALKKHLKDLGVTVKSHMSIVDEETVKKMRRIFNAEIDAVKKIETDRKKYYEKAKQIKKTLQEEDNQNSQSEKSTEDKLPEKVNYEKKYDNSSSKAKVESPFKDEIPVKKTIEIVQNPFAKPVPKRNEQNVEKSQSNTKRSHQTSTKKDNNRNYKNSSSANGSHSTKSSNSYNKNYQNNSQNNKSQNTHNKNNHSFNQKNDSFNVKSNANKSNNKSFKKTVIKPELDIIPDEKNKKRVVESKKKKAEDYGEKSRHLKAKISITKKSKSAKYKHLTAQEEAEIQKSINSVLSSNKKKKKAKKEEKQITSKEENNNITISEFTSVSELAKLMDVNATEIISKFFEMGQMVTINQRLDRDSLEMICAEFDFEVEFEDEYGKDLLEEEVITNLDEIIETERPPIVTIMGHVDHGKTSILDYIRNSNVIAGESGGITQHIGAYQVTKNNKKITFLDTPGHEAFTAMRARGANITDIAVIVVAANDGVMPQTIEAIDHAKAAGVTIIVAINKVDLPEANIERTKANLAEQGLYLEGYGGEVLWAQTSAKTGEGIDELLELILLASEVAELKARSNGPGKGVVIEAEMNPNIGSIVTVLLQEGELKKGDAVVCGATYGRIRRMENERKKQINRIKPADVAVIYGLNEVPKAGDILNVVDNEKKARQISVERSLMRLEREKYTTTTNLNNLFTKIKENQMNELKLIVKADTDGSVEALCDSFEKLSNDEVRVNIIRKGVGGIMEADVTLAKASEAIIIGFHVRTNSMAKKQAEEANVEIRNYQIIYDAIQDIKLGLEGMLSPEISEVYLGTAVVKQIFKIKKVGTIAGCFVEKGTIKRDGKVRIFRNDIQIHEGELSSLKHYANDVKEVKSGTDCGLSIKEFNDIKEGDVIEVFTHQEVKRTL